MRLLRHATSDQCMQPSDPIQTFGQTFRDQPSTVLPDDLHVVMVFRPIITDEQHRSCSFQPQDNVSSAEENTTNQWPSAHQKDGARHPSSSQLSSRPAGARSAARPSRLSVEKSADPPAATNTEPAKTGQQKPLVEDV